MRSIFLAGILMLSATAVSAQLVVSAGAQLIVLDTGEVELQNTNLVNNGNITSGNSKFSFTGNNSSSISGTQPVNFFDMEMRKGNSSSVILQRNIGVAHRAIFTTGFLSLNGFDANLGNTGFLDGEQESSRVTATNGGGVLLNASLNAPAAANPGNLGAIITSSQNLGVVNIKRGHQFQTVIAGSNSILRYYDISPANNFSLNATLRFNYFDGELNGVTENSLVLFKSDNGINWSNNGATLKNDVTNFVEKSGLSTLTHFTLANSSVALPVNFIGFSIKCENTDVLISWKTGQEQNSSHFEVQKSGDGANWSTLGTVPAAGNSNTTTSYSFKSNSTLQNNFYRILEHDINGRIQISAVQRSSCGTPVQFSVWPNPAYDNLYISLASTFNSKVVIKLFDEKGTLVKMERYDALAGSNQFNLDISSLPKATYRLSMIWNNGTSKKTVNLVKH